MNASSPIRYTAINKTISAITVNLLWVGLLLLGTNWSRAQSYNNFQIDFTREGAWRYTHVPETSHQRNGRSIQDQLTGIGKRLAKLSVTNPLAYCTLQGDLQHYLQRLADQPADYGNPATFHAVLLWLNSFDEKIRSALSEGRWLAMHQEVTSDAIQEQALIGRNATTLPYGLLFRRADYRSKLVHVLLPGEVVRVLGAEKEYCHVICGTKKGYIAKAMINRIVEQ